MQYLIGLDDTDNQLSRGTGHKARLLAEAFMNEGLLCVKSISKHQLWKDPSLHYTSDNQAACLEVELSDLEAVISYSRDFLRQQYEDGSHPAFCFMEQINADQNLRNFAYATKHRFMDVSHAFELSNQRNIHLESLSENSRGVIGALAACALRAAGNDGYFIWLHALPRFRTGIYSAVEIQIALSIDIICTQDGVNVPDRDHVFVSDKIVPMLRDGKKVLFVEEVVNYNLYQCEILPSAFLRSMA